MSTNRSFARRREPWRAAALGALLLLTASLARGDEAPKNRACRSVHLWWQPASPGLAFYNEVTVDRSAEGTYFMVCGWNTGYFGIQELGNGKKLVLFSVWDPGRQNDPKSVADEQRVKMLHKDDKVRTGRFGNEGTGGQSFFDYDWKPGETYRLMVTAKPNGERTEYAGYFYVPEDKAWKHLVTFSTITGGKPLGGYYSFVEDFRRNGVSATKQRKARFGNGWLMTADGQWHALTKATFTADRNPATNINAGTEGDAFFLATGGETENSGTKLRETVERATDADRNPPEDLPAAPAKQP
jgi:hypothetical protein